MKTLNHIKVVLGRHKQEMQERYKIRKLGVFGSYVRAEHKRNSDIDILVDFAEPVGLFRFMDIEEYLEGLLKAKVDLVSKRAMKPHIGKHILSEVVYI
ncbi:MAG: nucleotidyltransferase family protein [Planctomycetes bacterium]|nr:nucleotidyltransferase family protein [Planctomycetota bacterium]